MREVNIGDIWQWIPNKELYLIIKPDYSTSRCDSLHINSKKEVDITLLHEANKNWKFISKNNKIVKVLYGRVD